MTAVATVGMPKREMPNGTSLLAGPALRRTILHADLDAFYASVEQHDNPELAGRPVVVGGAPEARGVVAAASYEARRFGIRSAMSMRAALRLCPSAVRVAPRFDRYGAISAEVMAIFQRLSDLVEPLSLDEAYLDVTHRVVSGAEAGELGRALKQEVLADVGLRISVGVASTKSAAKIASDLRKPDALVVVAPGDERDFLAPLAVGKLWGIGPRAEERLGQMGINTIGQLAEVDRTALIHVFGRWGAEFCDLARGIDERPVAPRGDAKSVGRETTFAIDRRDGSELRSVLRDLCGAVAERLGRRSLRGRTVAIKVRRHDFSTHTRQTTLTMTLRDAQTIMDIAGRLLDDELGPDDRLRLLGVSVSGFGESAQLPLFPLD